MRIALASLICLLTAAGCHKPRGTVLGKSPEGELRSVLSVKAGHTPPHVTVRGVMVEKCPVAGCWFRLRDGTGVIKVDTKAAGFVVVNVPLESQMTVAGKAVAEGDEVIIEAAGIRY